MTGISPTLNVPQAQFLAMPHKFKAYVAGFGSGKTWVGCGGICKGMWEHPRINQGYFAPTYHISGMAGAAVSAAAGSGAGAGAGANVPCRRAGAGRDVHG